MEREEEWEIGEDRCCMYIYTFVENSLPLLIALLDWVIRHIFCGGTEQRSKKWNRGHRLESCPTRDRAECCS